MATSITNTSVTTDNLTVDTNTLYVDSTNNRVGVNTTNPGSTLEINGAAQVTGNALTVSDAGFNSRINLFNTGSGGSNFSIYSTMSSFGQGANTFLLYSPNATAGIIKAHEDGYVHMTYQPRFSSYNNNAGDFTVNGNSKITCFTGTSINVGSNYNTSNQRFTAPVAGCYFFGAHFRMGAPGSIRVFRAELRKNGSYVTDLCSCGGNNNYDGGSGYDHPPAVGTHIMDLNANDYIELYTSSELSSSNTLYIQTGTRSRFFGYLLY